MIATLRRAWDWFYTDGRTFKALLLVLTALAIVAFCALDGHAGDRYWQYQRQLSDIPASVTYVVYEDYDSIGAVTIDSASCTRLLNQTFLIDDIKPSFIDVVLRWRGYGHPISERVWMGNSWVATGDSVTYPIRVYFCDSLEQLNRTVLIDTTTYSTVSMIPGPWCDTGSLIGSFGSSVLRLPDTCLVKIVYREIYPGGDTSGFTEIFPTQSLSSTVEYVDTCMPVTIYDLPTPSAATIASVFGIVRSQDNTGLEGAVVTAFRAGVGYDTTGAGTIIVSRSTVVSSDSSGLFTLSLRRTHNFSDTTMGFYTIVGQYDGGEIFRIERLYVPSTGNVNLTDSLLARQ